MTNPAEQFAGDIEDAVGWAVERGLTRETIIRELRYAIEVVEDDPDIPE